MSGRFDIPIVTVNGVSHYDAEAMCELLGISNYMAAIAGLTLDIHKVVYLKDKTEMFALTRLGVKYLIDGLKRKNVKSKILRYFDCEVESDKKQVVEKPLGKNVLVEFLRTVYSERKIQTNWVVPTTEKTIDIFIPGMNGRDSIAVICDATRAEPLHITQEEMQIAFNLKATTQQTIQWVLFRDYESKHPTESFFTLINQINMILYGPFNAIPEKKRRVRKAPKKTSKKS